MTVKDYEELVKLLDGRIDELTKPIPSKQILRFAEAIRSAIVNEDDAEGTFSEDDYSNLLQAQIIVNEVMPQIMENIRAGLNRCPRAMVMPTCAQFAGSHFNTLTGL